MSEARETAQSLLNVAGIVAPLTVLRWRLSTGTKRGDADWWAFLAAQLLLAWANVAALIVRAWG